MTDTDRFEAMASGGWTMRRDAVSSEWRCMDGAFTWLGSGSTARRAVDDAILRLRADLEIDREPTAPEDSATATTPEGKI